MRPTIGRVHNDHSSIGSRCVKTLLGLRTVRFLVTLVCSLLMIPCSSDAQPGEHVHRIGFLTNRSPITARVYIEAFQQGLRDLGYVEGQNVDITYRYAEGQKERLPGLAAELVRLPVDVIVTGGSQAIRAAQHATRMIPIVMAGTADPVAQGFVASLARPGGNITGLSDLSVELPGKRLELLKEIVPQSTRIAVLTDPYSPYHTGYMRALTIAAQALGLHLHVVEVRRADALDSAFAEIARKGADALLVMQVGILDRGVSGPGQLVDLSAHHRLPTMYTRQEVVTAGGLMSYGPNIPDNWRRAVIYIDKILKGANPADLPVQQPITFDLVINLKMAKALGLTIPPTVLYQADEVIQ